MTLTELFDSTPVNKRRKFINIIAEETGKTSANVYRWVNGTVYPQLSDKKIIAQYLNMSIDELFPEL
jgi:transcriptional regulator with XRE-family HTH domain